MQTRALNPRVILNSGVLLLGAVLAHAIACGTFIPLLPFAGISVVLIALLSLLGSRELKAPVLISVVVFTQLAGHFLLGTSQMKMWAPICGGTTMSYTRVIIASSMNSTPMILSHIIAGIFSFMFIRRSEAFWNFAGYLLYSLFVPVYRPASKFKVVSLADIRMVFCQFVTNLLSFLTEATTRLTAPPALLKTF